MKYMKCMKYMKHMKCMKGMKFMNCMKCMKRQSAEGYEEGRGQSGTVPRTKTFENVHHVQMLEDVEFASTVMLKYRASLREGRALLRKYRALLRNVYLVQTLRHFEFARRYSCLGCLEQGSFAGT